MPKISEYTAASTPSGAELIPAVQGGTTKKLTVTQILSIVYSKAEVDALIAALTSGIDWKASARVAATSNVTISAPGSSIDGVTLSAGPPKDRVLLTAQSTASQNGLYDFNGAASPLTRSVDADTSAEVTAGMSVGVTEGTANGDAVWLLVTNDPITLGSTSLTFTKLPTSLSGLLLTTGHNNNSVPVSIAGTLADLDFGASTIFARLASGNIVAATVAQIKTLLALAESDVTGLVADLAAKAAIQETVDNHGNTGSSYTIPDVTTATIHRITLNAATVTLTFPTAAAGKSFVIEATQDGTGGRLITWPGTVKWPAATAPTLATVAAHVDVLVFSCYDGTNWRGALAGANYSS